MKMYERITAENWIKGRMGTPERGCLHAHLKVYNDREWLTAGVKLMNTIEALYPERAVGGMISSFNDHPETTLEDVLRVCKVADV